MCGSYGTLRNVRIEGTELSVCNRCARFGTAVRMSKPATAPRRRTRALETEFQSEYVVKPTIGSILKKEREKRGKTQKEMAILLKEKESIINKIESGHYTVNLALARKLQSILDVPLLQKEKKLSLDTVQHPEQKADGPLTLGDLIKKK